MAHATVIALKLVCSMGVRKFYGPLNLRVFYEPTNQRSPNQNQSATGAHYRIRAYAINLCG